MINDPVVFHKLKIRYAYLLGMLHAMSYYNIDNQDDLCRIDEEISNLGSDILNCGWGTELPPLQMIVDENDYMNGIFPVHVEEMEKENDCGIS